MTFCFPFGHIGKILLPDQEAVVQSSRNWPLFSLNISILKLLYSLKVQYAIKNAIKVNI